MHEVSLRTASNRMDAHNLSIVLCPNLVKSPNPARDVMMCAVPGGPAIFESNARPPPTAAALSEPQPDRTTLGMVICACIQRYYEVFDEVWDRSEARPPAGHGPSARSSASASPVPTPAEPAHDNEDDDDDIDDAMLVMPIGPGGAKMGRPPSAWAAPAGGTSTYKPRHRSNMSGGTSSAVRSVHTTFGEGNGSIGGGGYAYPSMSKAKSMISIENGTGTHGGRKGSISVGRGTTRKSSGAGVEAISITAEGFFSAPSNAPPVPLRRTNGNGQNGGM